ncbi:BTAD domain-containing putative transcriptional regulator [Nonomuraea sp. NPDC049152]|uniref:AfsR/SARP family transcriptional regulator n=1 Tax=Nonomuraea sp. NPDC049152 TaxID=3154350 RepID=UPI0033FF2C61
MRVKGEYGMEIRLLGPLEVRDAGGTLVPVTSVKQRVVLAALALRVPHVVSVEELVDCLWEDRPPETARETVRSHVTRLRKALSAIRPTPLVTRAPGYVLDVPTDAIDLHQAQALRAEATRAAGLGDMAAAAALLTDALARWRGPLLADVDSALLRSLHVRAWEDVWVQMMEARIDADLALGRQDALLGELRSLVAAHPLRERFRGQLMVALEASGQRAEALREYGEAWRTLVDELGVEPGAYLREIHQRILAADAARPEPPQEPAPVAVPALLPLDLYGFTGRAEELHRLDALMDMAGEQPTTVVVTAVSGTAGVGKTALAVHWAHQVRDRFTDGQLYVNLRGFDPSGSPMAPTEALRGFLDALGMPADRLPAGFQEQVGLYRSLLAGRRMLVLLDNARDAEQVRPLLPGAPGCLVVVTSRNRLPGLVVTEGAHSLPLDLLPVAEARRLLAGRLGLERVEAEPDAVEEIIARCAGLPLALAVVAARAATHPDLPLAALAAELREADGGLDAFDAGDPATQVRAVFSWSHHALGAEAAQLFRSLGLHPGPDLGVGAAASLGGVPVTRVRPLLAELVRAHLITQHTPGRYALHDLLRTHATELAHAHDRDEERLAALHRMLDHYLHTAHAATRLLNPHREPISLDTAPPADGGENVADPEQALAWFTAEHAVLLAAIPYAFAAGFDAHAWQIAWSLTDFLDRQGRWQEQVTIQEIALKAACRAGDTAGQAHTHRNLGWAHARLDHLYDAHAHFLLAVNLYGELGDHIGQAHTHGNISGVLERQGRYQDALAHAQRALELFKAVGHRTGQARALNAVGWRHALLGHYDKALDHCHQALTLHRESGDRYGQANTWDSTGYAHHQLGQHERAITCYQHALDLFREVGHRYHEADTLTRLGTAQLEAGRADVARRTWQRALDIFDELGHPDADRIRAKLAR